MSTIIDRTIKYFAETIINYRKYCISVCIITMLLMPMSFGNLYFANSDEIFFLPDDPNIEIFNNFIELFGEPDVLAVGIEALDGDRTVFNEITISAINDITQFLEEHPSIIKVRSITNYQTTFADEDSFKIEDLFEDLNEGLSAIDLAVAREKIKGEPLALKRIITSDLMHTQILAKVEYKPDENQHNVDLVTDLFDFLESSGIERSGLKVHISGGPLISERFETVSKADMKIVNPLMTLMLIVVLFLCFKSIAITLITFLVVGLVFLSVTTLQSLLSWPFTPVNTALIPTSIIIGVSGSVHVIIAFLSERTQCKCSKIAAKNTIVRLYKPMCFASLTTFIGFYVLSITELLPVRQFAVLAAFIPIILFFFSMTLLPCLLSFTKITQEPKSFNFSSIISKLTRPLPAFLFKHRFGVSLVGLVVLALGIYSSTYVRVDTNYINYFKNDDWVKKDLMYFDQNFKGTINLEFIVDSGGANGISNPSFLRRVEALQSYLESLSETGEALSVINFLKQTNKAINSNNEKYYVIPTSSNLISQIFLLYENSGPTEDLSDLRSHDNRYMRVSIPTVNLNSTATTVLLNTIDAAIALEFDDLSIQVTGPSVLYHAQNSYVNSGMVKSFLLALALISLCFFVAFWSIKYGIIAMIPSVFPILITAGIASAFGVSLDLGSMIIGAMTIGIAVDDSIHVLSRYLYSKKAGYTQAQSISAAINESGKAVILSSIILVMGFGVMTSASFVPYINTGLFSCIIMLLALIGDLIFLPAFLYVVDGKGSLLDRLYAAHQQAAD